MKVLISGGKGLLAVNILPYLGERFDLAVYDIDEWDITSVSRGRDLMDLHRPDVVLNLAAMTDVDGCEDSQELARQVNADGAGTVAELCAAAGTRLVHMSTDYVFDGTKGSPYSEDDEPAPASVYGRTKLAGERMVLERLPGAAVLRTQWLYGKGGKSFVDTITGLGRQHGKVRVVDDQRGSPTWARDLAAPIISIIEKGLSGIYHVSNSGSCTWFEFARAIFSILNMDVEASPISSDELGRKAARPAFSVFDLTKLEGSTGIRMRGWMDALREYLATGG
ncbi:MAG: dTDP-4-dehydrorhamnose reductase [Syntrophorhabdus sp.]|jgi:dTDP-4-dehydrorhamnose reductase|nr:dTDP-4-dehydrorhamnose reductase [Syntrophorhabdus sp.]